MRSHPASPRTDATAVAELGEALQPQASRWTRREAADFCLLLTADDLPPSHSR